jgi:hypothetical protein
MDQDIDRIKAELTQHIADLETALEESDARAEAAATSARQIALAELEAVRADARRSTLLEAAEFLMVMAQGRRPLNLVEAAREIEGRAAVAGNA